MNRRDFILQSFAASAAFGTGAFVSAQTVSSANAPSNQPPAIGTEPKRGAPLDVATVKAFVGAGHGNLPRVKEMLATQPKLVLASYDWGTGDFETALGGAAHTGRREIAFYLLEAGARIDAFCAAMLGETDIVTSLIRFSPITATTPGPHGYTLLYHAGYSGNVAIAEAIVPQLKDRARHCNQALQSASLRGHIGLVAWLIENGADEMNTKNFAGKTPLDLAIQHGHREVVALLRARGGLTTL